MIRSTLVFSLLLVLVTFRSQSQTIGDLRPIVGLTYGTVAESFGLTLGAEYLLLDNFAVAPSYEFYFIDEVTKLRSTNIDIRYYFMPGQLQFYGMFGYAINTSDYPAELKITKSGINVGAGTVYRFMFFDRIAAFGQVKYSTANKKQFSAMGGITYFFNIL